MAIHKFQHIINAITQMPLEHWQAWGISHHTRKSLLVFDHPHSKKKFPWCSVWLSPSRFVPFPSCHQQDQSRSPPSASLSQRAAEVTPGSPFIQAGQTSLYLQDKPSALLPPPVPSGHFQWPQHPFYVLEPSTAHNTQREATPTWIILRKSPLLTSWICCV